MDFDAMPWLVTSESETFGPFNKTAAVDYRDHLRAEGKQAEAWAAQVPNERMLSKP